MSMVWTFEKVRLKGFNFVASEWMLKITSLPQLWEYYAKTRPSMIGDAFEDFKKATSRLVQRDHFTNHVTIASYLLAEAKDCSFVESIARLMTRVERNQIDSLARGKVLYIREIGSYVDDDGTHYDVLDSYEAPELLFPEANIRLIQWPNGKHWYAKIGNIDVVVDDEQKWNTKSDAKKAALRYLRENWKPRRVD